MMIACIERLIFFQFNATLCNFIMLTCPCNVDPLHPLSYSKIGVDRGIPFSYFCSKT